MHELIRIECLLYREHCNKSLVLRLGCASESPVGLFRNMDVQPPPRLIEELSQGVG